jgi:hypothetical protein
MREDIEDADRVDADKGLLHRHLAEMRVAQPFTKFSVATSLGGAMGLLLIIAFPNDGGLAAAVVVAIAIASAAWWAFRKT